MAVPSSSSSFAGVPRIVPTITMTATAPHAMVPRTLVRESSSFCSGDRVRVTELSIVAIWPIWVCIPVAVTTIVPVPRVTDVFWNSMLVRSPSPTSADPSAPASLAIGALSPVSAASCASSVADRTIRPSAGTMSPASTWTMSPGTTSVAGTRATELSRSTRACGTCSLASASTLALAVSSCRVPSVRFSTISRATMIPVDTSPISRLTTTTATSMMFIGSRSWSRAILQADGGFSAAISLAPNFVSRLARPLPPSGRRRRPSQPLRPRHPQQVPKEVCQSLPVPRPCRSSTMPLSCVDRVGGDRGPGLTVQHGQPYRRWSRSLRASRSVRRTSRRLGPLAPSTPQRTPQPASCEGVARRIARWSAVPHPL